MDYKDTLLLPKTTFPMRGNLVQNEPKRYTSWNESKVYDRMKLNREDAEQFTLHDGPPYANGHIHIGHALNKVLKDIIVKHNYFNGKSVRFTPGWDCHGLPIEQQVEKKLGKTKKEAMPKEKLRELCRAHAKKFVDIQSDEFKALGILADWENPYVTMDFKFEANIFRSLAKVASAGLLKERKKPVYWSWAAKTALAEAEVEYEDREDYSIYVSFELSHAAKKTLGIQKGALVIWTTTPWTLPSNMGISLNPEENYVLTTNGYIVAQKRHETLVEDGLALGDVEKVFASTKLENLIAENPLNNRASHIMLGDHVLMDGGSGAVHTAPGHGEDDYHVSLKYGLDVVMPVDEDGKFDEMVKGLKLMPNPDDFIGRRVFDCNDDIVELLGDACLKSSKFTHSYPHCWRTHTPVLYRATKQWFIMMDEGETTLRDSAMKAVDETDFTPAWGQKRLKTMVENRPDWCISRQRDWGVPIAFFRLKATGEVLMEEKIHNFVAAMFDRYGADAWYSMPIQNLLYPGCPYKADELEKVTDILDVWFDSGSTQHAVLKSRNYDCGKSRADLYLEGSDQHRGWFQSSLLIGCATENQAPYKEIITHGFAVDSKGEKMSKSKGNVVAPSEVIKKYGSEILRLWVALSDFTMDVKISDEILKQIAEQYRKLRNTTRFLLANIGDLETVMDVNELGELDRWIVAQAKEVFDEAKIAFDNYDFGKAFHRINNFLTVELSGIYMDLSKDRLYCDGLDSASRRSSQSAMFYIARTLIGTVAPVLTYTMDEAFDHAPKVLKGDCTDIFDFVTHKIPDVTSTLDTTYLKSVRDAFSTEVDALKKEGKIKATLELSLVTSADKIHTLNATDAEDWFVVSGVKKESSATSVATFSVADDSFSIIMAEAKKCPRCWKYNSVSEEEACARCAKVV
jgi:isoleucyl-tRNA synthetase